MLIICELSKIIAVMFIIVANSIMSAYNETTRENGEAYYSEKGEEMTENFSIDPNNLYLTHTPDNLQSVNTEHVKDFSYVNDDECLKSGLLDVLDNVVLPKKGRKSTNHEMYFTEFDDFSTGDKEPLRITIPIPQEEEPLEDTSQGIEKVESN